MKIRKFDVVSLRYGFLMGVLAIGGLGCGGPTISEEIGTDPAAPTVAASTLQPTLYDVAEYSDGSGTVHVKIWKGDWGSGDLHHPTAECAVPNDWVLVGGGAEIYESSDGGGLLTASYPDGVAQKWIVKSKDHGVSYEHYLRAYCIGLKLDGVSADLLKSQTLYLSEDSAGTSENPTASATISNQYVLVGGGARTNWSGAGILLYQSNGAAFAGGGGAWYGTGKDHAYADYGSLTAYAIGIRHCPTGYSGCLKTHAVEYSGSPSGTGYQNITSSETSPWAMTCPGGASGFGGAGRLLTDITPSGGGLGKGGVFVSTKDHLFLDSYFAKSNMIAIQKE